MRARQIYSTMKRCGTWKHSTSRVRLSFIKQMRGKQYGWDAMTQAWAWYLDGWKDSYNSKLVFKCKHGKSVDHCGECSDYEN